MSSISNLKFREMMKERHKGDLGKLKILIFKGCLKKCDFTSSELKELEATMNDTYTLEDLFLDGK